MDKKKKVYIIVTEHFDLIWRRCFDRDFCFKGQNFISYADLESYYIIDNIALCEKYDFYRFEIESVAVIKKFLEHHGEYRETLKKLVAEKRIYIPFTGNNIVDSNMVSGESIIRNYLYGQEYLKKEYGIVPEGMDRNDAFGNSAQIPQIARKFGTGWVYHITYSNCDKPYWRGIDGSTVYNYEARRVGYSGGYYKYAPCPQCKGQKDKDCPVCNNRRIDTEKMERLRVLPGCNADLIEKLDTPGYIYAGGEEILPDEHIIEWAVEHKDEYDIEFGNFESFIPYFRDKLDRVDNVSSAEIHSSAEVNTNNTGTYVTRIKTKQLLRKEENDLLSLESLAAILQAENYPAAEIEGIWDKLLFTMFHDAVTATHIDAAYAEIMDCFKEIDSAVKELGNTSLNKNVTNKDGVITVINPRGHILSGEAEIELTSAEDVILVDENGVNASISAYERKGNVISVKFIVNDIPPFSTRIYKIKNGAVKKSITNVGAVAFSVADAILTNKIEEDHEKVDSRSYTIENEFYKLTANKQGITEIFDKALNKVIAEESTYAVGEWILEHDEGSPWATLSDDMRRQGMKEYTKLISVEKAADHEKMTFEILPGAIDGYSVTGIFVSYSVMLQRNCDLVKFAAAVDWDTQNYRLRIAFPTNTTGKHFYDIPYGVIERKPYKHNIINSNGSSNWAAAAGDYPTVNWAGIEGKDFSISLLNKGIPSYQINNDDNGRENIFLSVLRSPSVGTYLHTPMEYSMTEYDGMRDAGKHHFEYALKSYRNGFSENSAVIDGIGYNAKLFAVEGEINLPPMPRLNSNNAYISGIKKSQDNKGIIYRIVEYKGIDGEMELLIPAGYKVTAAYETNLKEEKEKALHIEEGIIKIPIGKFAIMSLYLQG